MLGINVHGLRTPQCDCIEHPRQTRYLLVDGEPSEPWTSEGAPSTVSATSAAAREPASYEFPHTTGGMAAPGPLPSTMRHRVCRGGHRDKVPGVTPNHGGDHPQQRPTAYATAIREHLASSGGRFGGWLAIRDRRGQSSLRNRSLLNPYAITPGRQMLRRDVDCMGASRAHSQEGPCRLVRL